MAEAKTEKSTKKTSESKKDDSSKSSQSVKPSTKSSKKEKAEATKAPKKKLKASAAGGRSKATVAKSAKTPKSTKASVKSKSKSKSVAKGEIRDTAAKGTKKKKIVPKPVPTKIDLPEIKEILRAGLQFGHETKRWNPKMEKYIFGDKQGIHIIDVSKTLPLLEAAGDFLAEAIMRGPVIFVGTKRQAAGIVKEHAVAAGAHFVNTRWAGGLLTNFKQVKKSIKKLNDLERGFEEGIKGRTKYEISVMKSKWQRLERLYGGMKKMDQLPTAVVIIDTNYESGVVRECNYLNIPVVAVVDTNCDPTYIDYPIPANDDAIGSVKLVMNYLKDRILEQSASAFRVTHEFKDYSQIDVQIKKVEQGDEDKDAVAVAKSETENKTVSTKKAAKKATKTSSKASKKASKKASEKASENASKAKGTDTSDSKGKSKTSSKAAKAATKAADSKAKSSSKKKSTKEKSTDQSSKKQKKSAKKSSSAKKKSGKSAKEAGAGGILGKYQQERVEKSSKKS